MKPLTFLDVIWILDGAMRSVRLAVTSADLL